VRMQQATLWAPPIEGRPLSRNMKHDASKTLGEQTMKQRDAPRALQVGYSEHRRQPLSEMSHTPRHFFGFVTPPSYRRTPASSDKKCYNCAEKGHVRVKYPGYHRSLVMTQNSGYDRFHLAANGWGIIHPVPGKQSHHPRLKRRGHQPKKN
jgi:hypothetical protein